MDGENAGPHTYSFSSVKEIIRRMKQQATNWDKILSGHISTKGLAPKICKGLHTQQ